MKLFKISMLNRNCMKIQEHFWNPAIQIKHLKPRRKLNAFRSQMSWFSAPLSIIRFLFRFPGFPCCTKLTYQNWPNNWSQHSELWKRWNRTQKDGEFLPPLHSWENMNKIQKRWSWIGPKQWLMFPPLSAFYLREGANGWILSVIKNTNHFYIHVLNFKASLIFKHLDIIIIFISVTSIALQVTSMPPLCNPLWAQYLVF